MPWYEQYLTQEWEKKFRSQTRKVFSSHPELVDDAHAEAWLKLLTKFETGDIKQISDAYIMAAYKNALFDYYRQEIGRCRALAWVTRLGPVWVRTAEILCLESLPVNDIVKRVCKQPDEARFNCCETVNSAVSKMKTKAYCSTRWSRDDKQEAENLQREKKSTDGALTKDELQLLVSTILTSGKLSNTQLSSHIINLWSQLASEMALSDDERLLLARVYWEGDNVNQLARNLGLPPQKVRRPLKKVLARIRQVFHQHDISFNDLI